MTTTEATEQDPTRIQPWHEEYDEDKVETLAESMRANGWIGAPIVTIEARDYGWGPGDPIAITGSHRIQAAREAGIDTPIVSLDAILAEHGTSLAALDEQCGTDPDDERHEQVVVRLADHLPAAVIECYGLDAH